MRFLLRAADWIDAANGRIGRACRWLTLALVLVQFFVVALRYVFGTSFVYFQEAVVYVHVGVFMIGGGYTLLHEGHVRVDLFYGEASSRRKAWVDFLGVLFLLGPSMGAILYFTWPFVRNSWAILEGPLNVGGIPAAFVLKTMIPVFAVLILAQGASMAIRAFAHLNGAGPYPYPPPDL